MTYIIIIVLYTPSISTYIFNIVHLLILIFHEIIIINIINYFSILYIGFRIPVTNFIFCKYI